MSPGDYPFTIYFDDETLSTPSSDNLSITFSGDVATFTLNLRDPTGYFLIVQDNSTVPPANDSRWQPVSNGYQLALTSLSNPVSPTFYAWVRDDAGNITNQFSKSVQVGQLWTQTSGILPNFSAFDDNETIGIAFSTSLSSNFSAPGILLRNLTDNSSASVEEIGAEELTTTQSSILTIPA